LFVRTHTE